MRRLCREFSPAFRTAAAHTLLHHYREDQLVLFCTDEKNLRRGAVSPLQLLLLLRCPVPRLSLSRTATD